jgi:hypothetical protein
MNERVFALFILQLGTNVHVLFVDSKHKQAQISQMKCSLLPNSNSTTKIHYAK